MTNYLRWVLVVIFVHILAVHIITIETATDIPWLDYLFAPFTMGILAMTLQSATQAEIAQHATKAAIHTHKEKP